MNVKLIDKSRTIVAAAQMADEDSHYGGTIDLASSPADLRVLFDEFEEAVNGQMFSFADDIQAKIGQQLRSYYDTLIEPTPDRFAELLRQLEKPAKILGRHGGERRMTERLDREALHAAVKNTIVRLG